MKTLMRVVTFLTVATLVNAADPADDAARMDKLSRVPISVYSNFDARGSALLAYLNDVARPTDALVISSLDALKVQARISQWQLAQAEVWVHVFGEVSVRDTHRRNLEGAKGIVLVPPPAPRGSALRLRSVNERLGSDARQAGMRYVVGLEEEDLRLRANAEEMAIGADIVTIHLPRKLKGSPQEFRALFSRIVTDARQANPAVQVELALPTGGSAAATQHIAGVVWDNADLFDRVGFHCNDSGASLESLRTLFAVLRPAGAGAVAK